MVFALPIVGEPGAAEGLDQDRLGDIRGGRRRPGDVAATASSSAERATRASPPDQRASLSISSGSTRGFDDWRGRARGQRGRASGSWRCLPRAAVRESTTRQRESSAALTSNDGFSVVAPIRVIVPSSTAPKQCVLLPLVEAMDLVDEENRSPPALLALPGVFDGGPNVFHAGENGRERDEVCGVASGDQAARAWSCPSRAVPRG